MPPTVRDSRKHSQTLLLAPEISH